MIRINLLPVRAAKKKETALQQIVIFVAGIILVLLICLGMIFFKGWQMNGVKNDITAANAKISELKAKIGKLDEITKWKDEVKKKLDVLAQLRKNKSGPAQRLSTLSDITPDQLWLTSYREAGDSIRISGLSTNEELIAQFMRALEASADYEKVELVVSEQQDLAGMKLKKFELTFNLEKPKAPEPAKASAGK